MVAEAGVLSAEGPRLPGLLVEGMWPGPRAGPRRKSSVLRRAGTSPLAQAPYKGAPAILFQHRHRKLPSFPPGLSFFLLSHFPASSHNRPEAQGSELDMSPGLACFLLSHFPASSPNQGELPR